MLTSKISPISLSRLHGCNRSLSLSQGVGHKWNSFRVGAR
jgi:hypothetical protein